MKLIQNWKKSPRMFSTQCLALAVAIQTTWVSLPAKMQESIPVEWVCVVTIVVSALGIIGRLIDQPKVNE